MLQRTLAFGVFSTSVAPFAYEHATAPFAFLGLFESIRTVHVVERLVRAPDCRTATS